MGPLKGEEPSNGVRHDFAAQDRSGVDTAQALKPALDEESEIWEGRTHWKHFSGRLLLWLLANAFVDAVTIWIAARSDRLSAKAALAVILALFVISGAFVLGRIALQVLGRRFRLTTQRLFVIRGILSQTVDQLELIRVDDVRIHKTALDRVFRLGSIEILSTDSSNRDLTIAGVAAPEQLAEAIREHMRRLRTKSLYVERL